MAHAGVGEGIWKGEEGRILGSNSRPEEAGGNVQKAI